jgi:hypothetical protein
MNLNPGEIARALRDASVNIDRGTFDGLQLSRVLALLARHYLRTVEHQNPDSFYGLAEDPAIGLLRHEVANIEGLARSASTVLDTFGTTAALVEWAREVEA